MLLAVFSDSHGNPRFMADAVARHNPDHVIFLGDGVRDAQRVRAQHPETRFLILRGNCDPDLSCEQEALLELDGVGIFAAHGHNHGVKYGLARFCTSVWCSGAKLGLYGHTHRPLWQDIRGMQIMNPGSIGNTQHPTYGLVRIENGAADCRILDARAER